MAGVRCQPAPGPRRTGSDVQNAGSDGADKMNVVTNKDERPVILLERADEGIDRANIEMCRRLVHEQKVRWIEQQPDERQSRFIATAQDANGFENIVAVKQK